jgi:hypothetical protein
MMHAATEVHESPRPGSHVADRLDVDEVRHLLAGQLERSAAGAVAARRSLPKRTDSMQPLLACWCTWTPFTV